jgi:hypothetical protein
LNGRLEKFAPPSLNFAASGIFKTRFMTTWRRALRFTPMHCTPMTA